MDTQGLYSDFVLDIKNSVLFFRSTTLKEMQNLEVEIVLFASLMQDFSKHFQLLILSLSEVASWGLTVFYLCGIP